MINATHYSVGQPIFAVSARLETAKTKPPEHYTEASLMDDMLGAYKFAKSEDDRALLKQIAGIGTARTRGVIIEAFVKRGFLLRIKKGKSQQLQISPEGRALLAGLPDMIKDVAMTAKWERALVMVAEGKAKPAQLMDKVRSMLNELVPKMLNQAAAGKK